MPYISISDVAPLQRENCHQWLNWKGDYCGNKAGQRRERCQAERLWTKILPLAPADPRLFALLLELAEMMHCRRWHRTQQQIHRTAQHWYDELRASSAILVRDTPPGDAPTLVSRPTTSLMERADLIAEPSLLLYPPPSSPPQAAMIRRMEPAVTLERPVSNPPYPSTVSIPESAVQDLQPSNPPPAAMRPAQTRYDLRPSATRNDVPIRNHGRADQTVASHSRPVFTNRNAEVCSSNAIHRRIVDLVQQPLRATALKPGYLYMYTRAESPGFVKIGYSNNIDRRMVEWRRRCQYDPVLAYSSALLPNVFRVEQLIFTELLNQRRLDHRCVDRSLCNQTHQEWLEISVDAATTVIKRWEKWIQKEPYGSGLLSQNWISYCGKWLQLKLESAPGTATCHYGDDLPPQGASSLGECAICLDSLSATEELRKACSQCHKSFWHEACIDRWLRSNSTCPQCRHSWGLVKVKEEEETRDIWDIAAESDGSGATTA